MRRKVAEVTTTSALTIPVSGGPVFRQQFSADKTRLQEALLALRFHPQNDAAPVPLEQKQASAVTAILSLQAVLRGLKAIPGRKNVVFFSENMWLYKNPQVLTWFGGYDEYGLKVRMESGEVIASLSTAANLASVVFYTADPRRLVPGAYAPLEKEQIETYADPEARAKEWIAMTQPTA